MSAAITHKLHSFKSLVLPRRVLLDTNFILNLITSLGTFRTHVADCEEFSGRLEKNASEIYITDWVLNEVYHQIYSMKLAEELAADASLSKKYEGKPMVYHREQPNAIAKHHHIVKQVADLLKQLSCNRILEESSYAVRNRAFDYMQRFHIMPTDAYILATAVVNKLDGIATVNYKDFARPAHKEIMSAYVPEPLVKYANALK